jgi:hypothetical protein
VSAEVDQLCTGNSTTCGFVVTINDKVKQVQKRLQEVAYTLSRYSTSDNLNNYWFFVSKLCSGQRELWGRREFDIESWGTKYFFTVDFLANPQIMRRKFVEYLGTDLFSARRIQNVGLRINSYSWWFIETDSHVGL